MHAVADVRVKDRNKTPLQNHTAYCNVNVLSLNYVHHGFGCLFHGHWAKGGKGQWVPAPVFFTLLFRVKFKVPMLNVPTSLKIPKLKVLCSSAYDSKFLLFKVPMTQSSYSSKFLRSKFLRVRGSYCCKATGSKFLLL